MTDNQDNNDETKAAAVEALRNNVGGHSNMLDAVGRHRTAGAATPALRSGAGGGNAGSTHQPATKGDVAERFHQARNGPLAHNDHLPEPAPRSGPDWIAL